MAIPFRYQFLLVLFFTSLHFESFSQTKVDEIISKYSTKFNSYEDLTDKIKIDFTEHSLIFCIFIKSDFDYA